MKILFIGDIVGRPGRRILREKLVEAQETSAADLTIANVENVAGGFGITPKLAEQILNLGIDVMTSGNHLWDRKEILDYLDSQARLLRPGNYPPGTPGNSTYLARLEDGREAAVLNLQGRVFMPSIDCPFRFIDQELSALKERTRVIIVDFHAEATSEKMAFGWYVDGRVSAVVGTHTHVPTADARVFSKGTAYVTDVGMTGSYDSVIGMEKTASISRFVTGLHSRFEPASGNRRFSSVVLDIDAQTGRATSINRLDLK
jgi:metallophosphoesterase (TIGR00282 family)